MGGNVLRRGDSDCPSHDPWQNASNTYVRPLYGIEAGWCGNRDVRGPPFVHRFLLFLPPYQANQLHAVPPGISFIVFALEVPTRRTGGRERAMTLRLWGTFALCMAALAPIASRAEESVPKTGVFILVDVSATWLSKENQEQNQRTLAEVNAAVLDLIGKTETPAAIYVIAIQADSILNPPICEGVYRKTLLNVKRKKGEFTRREDLVNYLDLCRAAVLNRPPSRWTDIHGALGTVSQISKGVAFNHRYLFVLSDFKEERPKGDLPTLSLPGFRVGSIYRVLPEDSRNPKGLEDRLAKWHGVLRQAGAAKAVDAVDKVRFAGSLVQRLLSSDNVWK
jgi:hypothetical protein